MEMKPIEHSSNIKAVGYEAGVLRIQFASGKAYDYPGVKPEQHAELMAAPSIGSHFAKTIRPQFDGVQVDSEAKSSAPAIVVTIL
ncbi:KTSC domain-containing protein [Nevskia ramosa]|uniref:KTSC domain-containing protein n=1 Tax=Nevskia ramosa TaxID=64002 RepID=UPI003D09B55F